MNYNLSQIISIIGGGTPKTSIPEYWDGDIPWLSVKDFNNDNKYVYKTEKCISELGLKNSSTKILSKNDIIISARGTVGEIAMIPYEMAFNQSCYGLRAKSNIIDNNYLFYLVKSKIRELQFNTHGSVFDTITRNTFKNIVVDIPLLKDQKKIASILSALDDKIELNNKINKNLEEMAQAIFKSWFVDFEPWGGEMPDDWEYGTFSKTIMDTIGGDWGKPNQQKNFTEQVYCIRGADIPEISQGKSGNPPTRFILKKNLINKKLENNDLAIEISGGSPTQSTGRCLLITEQLINKYEDPIICTNFCRALKIKTGYSIFVYYYFKYLYKKGLFFSYENGTTGIKNLNLKDLISKEEIIIPSDKYLSEFTRITSSLNNKIMKSGIENKNLSNLRDTLLPKLMSGELDVSDLDI